MNNLENISQLDPFERNQAWFRNIGPGSVREYRENGFSRNRNVIEGKATPQTPQSKLKQKRRNQKPAQGILKSITKDTKISTKSWNWKKQILAEFNRTSANEIKWEQKQNDTVIEIDNTDPHPQPSVNTIQLLIVEEIIDVDEISDIENTAAKGIPPKSKTKQNLTQFDESGTKKTELTPRQNAVSWRPWM